MLALCQETQSKNTCCTISPNYTIPTCSFPGLVRKGSTSQKWYMRSHKGKCREKLRIKLIRYGIGTYMRFLRTPFIFLYLDYSERSNEGPMCFHWSVLKISSASIQTGGCHSVESRQMYLITVSSDMSGSISLILNTKIWYYIRSMHVARWIRSQYEVHWHQCRRSWVTLKGHWIVPVFASQILCTVLSLKSS